VHATRRSRLTARRWDRSCSTGPSQHSHPCRQRRRHIHDTLTRRDELLAKQIAETACRLDRPGSLFEPCRPTQQLVDLTSRRPHRHRRDLDLVAIDRNSRVRPLVRIDTDHHRHEHLPIAVRGRPGRALLIRNARTAAPLSNHAPARTSAGQHLDRKPVDAHRRQAVREPDPPRPPTLRATPQRHHELNQADMGVTAFRVVGVR
jgi:hypothetical protein